MDLMPTQVRNPSRVLVQADDGPVWRNFLDRSQSAGFVMVRGDWPGAMVEVVPESNVIIWQPVGWEEERIWTFK